MTAMSGDFDDDFDPEEAAENTASQAYQRVVLAKSTGLFVVAAGTVAFTVGDYVFGVMALWLVPRWLLGFLASFMVVELYVMATGYARSRRQRRDQDAGLSEGERMLARVDRMNAEPMSPPWWRFSPRSRRFWTGLLLRAVYSCFAGLVLVSHLGPVPGMIALAAFTGAGLVLRGKGGGIVADALAAVAFIDPRPPRDSPEA